MKLSELKDGAVVMDKDGDVWAKQNGEWDCSHPEEGLFWYSDSRVLGFAPLTLMVRGETLEDEHETE